MGKEEIDKVELVCTREEDSFEPLVDPSFVAGAAANLRPAEVVIGLELYGAAKAYPTSMLWLHHCVNDQVHFKYVLISLCSLSSSGVGFDASLGRNRRLTFELYGVYQGAMVLRDHQTGSLWSHLEGRCLQGPLAGRQLNPLPVIHNTWAQWLKEHPATQVLSNETPYRHRYRPLGQIKARLGSGYRRFPCRWRRALPPEALVLGIRTGERSWAYPLVALAPVVNHRLGSRPLVILHDRQAQHAVAYWRELAGEDITFRWAEGIIRDAETGSTWSREGRCLEGPLAGRALAFVPSLTVEWYAWSAYHPETLVVETMDAGPFEPEAG